MTEEPFMDLRTLMRQAAEYNANRTAIVHRDRALTFAEAWERAVRLANGLLAAGLRPGDRVGVLEDNSIGAQDFFAGSAAAGLVRVPLYARNSPESHHHMLWWPAVRPRGLCATHSRGAARRPLPAACCLPPLFFEIYDIIMIFGKILSSSTGSSSPAKSATMRFYKNLNMSLDSL